jgi:hypothetical protein
MEDGDRGRVLANITAPVDRRMARTKLDNNHLVEAPWWRKSRTKRNKMACDKELTITNSQRQRVHTRNILDGSQQQTRRQNTPCAWLPV